MSSRVVSESRLDLPVFLFIKPRSVSVYLAKLVVVRVIQPIVSQGVVDAVSTVVSERLNSVIRILLLLEV